MAIFPPWAFLYQLQLMWPTRRQAPSCFDLFLTCVTVLLFIFKKKITLIFTGGDLSDKYTGDCTGSGWQGFTLHSIEFHYNVLHGQKSYFNSFSDLKTWTSAKWTWTWTYCNALNCPLCFVIHWSKLKFPSHDLTTLHTTGGVASRGWVCHQRGCLVYKIY